MRFFLALLLAGLFGLAQAQDIARASLPPEGQHVLALIEAGGPFPYPRDGIVFRNFERLLPMEKRGYYREYTVRTPGLSHRGARRIVCGGWETRRPDACWYTADHYRSFRKIAE
jgi:ribonuclease T1